VIITEELIDVLDENGKKTGVGKRIELRPR
jgi:hypothetical protein